MILSKPAIRAEDRALVHEVVAVLAGGEAEPPRVDFEQLDSGEAAELVKLAGRIHEGELDRGHARFWRLVARGSGREESYFERQAEQARKQRKEAASKARERRMPFTKRETTNLFVALYQAMNEGDLFADDAAAIAVTLMVFAAGKPFAGTAATLEDSAEGPTLVFNVLATSLAPGLDDGGMLDGFRGRADFLAQEGWFAIAKSGPVWRLRLGARLRGALDGVPADAEMA
jgi:hypothetical protein